MHAAGGTRVPAQRAFAPRATDPRAGRRLTRPIDGPILAPMRRIAALVAAVAVAVAAPAAAAGGQDGKKVDARKGASISTFRVEA